jgi:tRNA-modifying protein YgfZ
MTTGYAALRHGAAVLDLSDRGKIHARGRDRARLLHNLTTNEVKKMQPGQGAYAFLLSPQGRIQADVLLFCYPEHFLIGSEPEQREKVFSHIRRYIIADQVELQDVTADFAVLGVEGPQAAALLTALGAPLPEAPLAHLDWNGATVAAVTATGQPGFRIILPVAQKADLEARLAAAGAVPATADDLRTVRIENGKPRYGEDIVETSLPQETQQMHAVSFSKGCYLGQEIVERIRARGHVNRKLVRIQFDTADLLPSGAKLTAADGEAGEITSSVLSPETGKVVGLGYVRTQYTEPGTELCAGDGGVTGRIG